MLIIFFVKFAFLFNLNEALWLFIDYIWKYLWLKVIEQIFFNIFLTLQLNEISNITFPIILKAIASMKYDSSKTVAKTWYPLKNFYELQSFLSQYKFYFFSKSSITHLSRPFATKSMKDTTSEKSPFNLSTRIITFIPKSFL